MRSATPRRTGLIGLLAALCLVAVALVPVLDSAVCNVEDNAQQRVASAVQAGTQVKAAFTFAKVAATPAPSSHDLDLDTCIHGHCHHFTPFAAPTDPPAAMLVAFRQPLQPGLGAIPPSAPPTHLTRPPRA